MPANRFLARFEFSADPFESTNADEEPLLGKYFVPPPYFSTVLGDPGNPSSHIVLAPRGSGKTAQRRMIEEMSLSANPRFLCVTYDSFDQPPGFKASDATLEYHLNQVCRRLVIALLMEIDQEPERLAGLMSRHQKEVLKVAVDRFLGGLSAQEFERAVRAIKSFGDKAREFWKKYGGPVAAAITILMRKAELDPVEIPPELAEESRLDASLPYYFQTLVETAQTLGFASTYVLVDKIDEISVTQGDATATWERGGIHFAPPSLLRPQHLGVHTKVTLTMWGVEELTAYPLLGIHSPIALRPSYT